MKTKKVSSRKKDSFPKGTLLTILLFLFLFVFVFAISKVQTIISHGATTSGGLSKSKLGIFITGASDGAKKIVDAGPRVIKVLDPQGNGGIQDLIRTYKTKFPDGTVVMRVFVTQAVQFPQEKEPETAADEFWVNFLKPAVDALPADVRSKIDYLNGTNYNENFYWNGLESEDELAWFSRFWVKLADDIVSVGLKPDFGEFYVAGIDANTLGPLATAFQKIKNVGGVWSYHGYTIHYTEDQKIENEYSLHYRSFYSYFQNSAPQFSTIPMILGEGGVDCEGRPKTDGWNGSDPEPGDRLYEYCGGNKNDGREGPILSRGNKEDFISWLKWYDSELQKDSYIKGITIYPIGRGSGDSGDLGPIADWFADYLKGQSGPPGNISTTPGQNGNGNPSPTKKPKCVPNWCIIDDSPCCFDPMCVLFGPLGYSSNRCS